MEPAQEEGYTYFETAMGETQERIATSFSLTAIKTDTQGFNYSCYSQSD